MITANKATIGMASLSIAAILATASLASIGIMQTNASAAPSTTMYKQKFSAGFATIVSSTETQDGITTLTFITAVRGTESGLGLCC